MSPTLMRARFCGPPSPITIEGLPIKLSAENLKAAIGTRSPTKIFSSNPIELSKSEVEPKNQSEAGPSVAESR